MPKRVHSPASSSRLLLLSINLQLLLLLNIPGNGVSIRYLPGLDAPLPSEMETGYVNVDQSQGIELFYYFFESENKPTEDPLLVWFTGGPGCSGVSAILFGNGPIKLRIAEYNGTRPTLDLNEYSWTKVANMLYIDAPVGSGFSYSTTKEGAHGDDIITAKQGYDFIRKWLIDHPKFLSNPLYIGGDSYSGKTIPITAYDLVNGLEVGDEPHINFKGYLLGNPITDRHLEGNSAFEFAYGMGLISKELFESAKKTCKEEYVNVDPNNVYCNNALQALKKCTSKLFDENILEPKCVQKVITSASDNIILPQKHWECKPKALTSRRSLIEKNSVGNFRSPPPISNINCKSFGYMLSYYWMNDDEVLKALKVRKEIVQEWLRCNQCGIDYNEDVVESATPYHLKLSKKPYRSLIYSGDHDSVVTFVSTEAWIKSLNYPISDEWRPWLIHDQVAGYTRRYSNNMTFATIKGAGHIALEWKPKEGFAMVKRWLSNKDL